MASSQMESILRPVAYRAIELMDVNRFYVVLYDDNRSYLDFPIVIEDGETVNWASRPYQRKAALPDYVIEHRTPLLVEKDLAEWLTNNSIDYSTGEPPLSWMGSPLTVEERVIGAIVAENRNKEMAFPEYSLRLLSTVAYQTAITIENARLHESLKRRMRELEILLEIYEKVTKLGVGSVDEAMELIYSETSRVIDLNNALFCIALYDEAKDEVSFALAAEQNSGIVVDRVRWGEREPDYRRLGEDPMVEQFKPRKRHDPPGLADYVIRTKRPLLISEDFERKASDLGVKTWPAFGRLDRPTYSWLGVPMIVHDRVIGVISIQSIEVEHAFDENHLEFLTAVASQTAAAIENARLIASKVESERLAYLGHVADGIAHRINNTIALIPLCVTDIRQHLDTVDDYTDENLEMISRNARYILSLADELRKPSRPSESGLFDVNLLLKEAVDFVNPQEATVITKLDETLPKVQTHRLLTDVFVELVTNAIEAMTESEVQHLEIGNRLVDEDYVEVWFRDTGKGIPEAEQERLFELFYTTAKKDPAEGKARGFGLWWIRTFLAWQGGGISVETQVDAGSTFIVKLPIRAQR